MGAKNARMKRKNRDKAIHKTFDAALLELKRLKAQNYRNGNPERNRGLVIYETSGGFRIGHQGQRGERRRIWEYYVNGQKQL